VDTLHFARVQDTPDGPRVTSRIQPLVTAASHFQTVMGEPGCPFRLLTKDEDAARNAYIADLEARVADLELQLEEASASPIDEMALLDNVRSIVRDEIDKPRRPGPKRAA